jgi:nucleoside-diphosphate-sugar epimerase
MPIIFNADATKVHDPLINGVLNTLRAAAHAGIKRYVLGSSSKAVSSTIFDHQPARELSADTFNHEAIEQVRRNTGENEEPTFERIVAIYSAGRALAELAFWDWVRENDPPFVANCVVPDGQFGRVLDVQNLNVGTASSTGQLMRALEGRWEDVGLSLVCGTFSGPFLLLFEYRDIDWTVMSANQVCSTAAFLTDVQDTARLLVAAVTVDSIRNERIFAYSVNRSWNDMRDKVRELFPDRLELVQGPEHDLKGKDTSTAPGPIARAEEILRLVGRPGFASEEQVIMDFVDSMYQEK